MVWLENVFSGFAGILWGNWLLMVLMGLGFLYTCITGGVQIWSIPYLLKITNKEKKEHSLQGLSSLQALYVSLASIVGSGNIVGVCTALISGGPGALFWMWVAAFLGMATKYGEIVLGICYRETDENGMFIGGPMYYIAKGLHLPWLGAAAAVLLFIQNAGATLIQSNTISSVITSLFPISELLVGICLAIVMACIMFGGLKRLAAAASKVVPVMAGLYIAGGLMVILTHLDAVGPVLRLIISQAFSVRAGTGAMAGFTIREAMRYGVARGLYSNEAGEGSAAVLHAAAEVSNPVRQGICGVADVFIDTMVICSTTGFSVLVSGVPLRGGTAATLTSAAFATVFPAFQYVVSVSLVLFAATSLMGQWYFGQVSLYYFKSHRAVTIYKVLFPLLVVYGSLGTTELVWAVQDCMLGLLVLPNIAALVVLAPRVRKVTKKYYMK